MVTPAFQPRREHAHIPNNLDHYNLYDQRLMKTTTPSLRNRVCITATAALAFLPVLAAESPHLAEILVDGEVGDWKGIAPVASDPAEAAKPCDWRKLFLAQDADNLYLRYTTEGAVDFNKGAAYMVLLDTDQSQQTGFQGSGGNLAIGADFLLQGTTLFRYTGTGTDWMWENLGTVTAEARANEAEFSVTLDQLESPSAVDIILYGDNEAEGVEGEILDVMPDNAFSPSGKISYSLK